MAAAGSWRGRFVVFWCSQFVSLTGLAFAMYAFGAYIYRLSGSSASLGIAFAIPIIPFVLGSPFAGVLVDRLGPRTALIISNACGLANLILLVVLYATGGFASGRVWLFLLVAAGIKSLHLAAFETATAFLVPKSQLARANGGRMALTAVGALIGPIIAGPLFAGLGFSGVTVMACATFLVGLVAVVVLPIPAPARTSASANPWRVLGGFWEACRYVGARRGLVGLFVCLAAVNAGIGAAELLFTQMTLSFTSYAGLDVVLAVGAAGLVLSSVAVVTWGGPRRRARGLTCCGLLMGAAMVVAGLRPDVALVAAAAFVFLGCTPIVISMVVTLSQLKVEPGLFGRTAAMRNVLIDGPYMLAEIVVGFAAGVAFVPLVGDHEVSSPILRAVVGSGPGRGYALLMIVVGLLVAACIATTYRRSGLRDLERDLPDRIPDDVPVGRGEPGTSTVDGGTGRTAGERMKVGPPAAAPRQSS